MIYNDGHIVVQADDEPVYGAHHVYRFDGIKAVPAENSDEPDYVRETVATIPFQKGPAGEQGVNGVSEEAVIAALVHRLQSFQESDLRCRQNALAITKLEEAAHWLQDRRRERERRGVEGTLQR